MPVDGLRHVLPESTTIHKFHQAEKACGNNNSAEKTKSEDKELDVATTQKKPALERFRLQVDQQTKASFDSLDAAEKVGRSIKKTHPVVQVSIYDAKEGETKIIG